MLRALINLFSSDDPLGMIGRDFAHMFELTHGMTMTAGRLYFHEESNAETRTNLFEMDIEVNTLERKIRKHLVAHLSLPGNQRDVPHGLALMSLVKDVERIGDYTKNLAEVIDLHADEFADNDIVEELREIRRGIESTFGDSLKVFGLEHDTAQALVVKGRQLSSRCEKLLQRIAGSNFDCSATTALVLGTRYYKRIAGHVVNVLTAIIMPIHMLDYYDEDAVTVGSGRTT